MRDLSGRVDRIERKLSARDDELIVLDMPYGDGIDVEAAQQRVLEERGLAPSDIGNRLVVWITNYYPKTHSAA